MTTQFLYIDPGTGSMLFSILIGVCATLFFFVKALWIKIKAFFTGGRAAKLDKTYKDFVIYAEDKRYYTVFLPLLREFEKNKVEVTYYTARQTDPIFKEKFTYIHPEAIGEGNKAYAKLNLLSAGVVIMSTPSLDVYQLKRSPNVAHYCHIFHSTSDATMYRLFSLDFFDSVLLTGDYQALNIRTLEAMRHLPPKQLVTIGCTYLDDEASLLSTLKENREGANDATSIEGNKTNPINNPTNNGINATNIEEIKKSMIYFPNKNKTVLVSPSWGPSALLSVYGERLLTPLLESGFNIILRPHPQSYISESTMLNALLEKYKDAPNLLVDRRQNNIYALEASDIMISDFSGIIYDYLFICDKPVIYAMQKVNLDIYDAHFIKDELWQFSVLKKAGIKIEEKDFPNIKEVIMKASDSKTLKEARHKARDEGYMYRGEAGVRAYNFLIQTLETIKNGEKDKKAA